jgi:hypothetical protein
MPAIRLHLQTTEATCLLTAATIGQTNLDKGRNEFQRALKNVEIVATVETLTTLRDSGRRYARAVAEHSQAIMAWLMYLDGEVRAAIGD